jgi:hypothetical protein
MFFKEDFEVHMFRKHNVSHLERRWIPKSTHWRQLIECPLPQFITFMPAILMWIWLAPLYALEVNYLAISGDGTASVVVDDSSAVAFITDGGRRGDQGIQGATINGQPVLEYLSGKVKQLVIACSHPHSDHLDGLKDLIKDQRILDFDVVFIDNGFEKLTGKKSLKTIYGRDLVSGFRIDLLDRVIKQLLHQLIPLGVFFSASSIP